MPYMPLHTVITVICGVVAGLLFVFASSVAAGGVLTLFLPVLPLAMPALALSSRNGAAAFIASCVTLAILNIQQALFFTICIAIPLFHFLRKALLWREEGGEREWHPILPVLAEITAMTAAIFMVFAISATHAGHGDLRQLVAEAVAGQLDGQLEDTDAKTAQLIKHLAGEWSFALFAVASWFWVILLYGFTVLANAVLTYNGAALRQSLGLYPKHLPLWLPGLLAISALFAFFAQGNDKFAGQVVFLILLLPYFLCGVAGVHASLRLSPARRLWLLFFYALLFLPWGTPWGILFLIAYGLYIQTEETVRKIAGRGER